MASEIRRTKCPLPFFPTLGCEKLGTLQILPRRNSLLRPQNAFYLGHLWRRFAANQIESVRTGSSKADNWLSENHTEVLVPVLPNNLALLWLVGLLPNRLREERGLFEVAWARLPTPVGNSR